MRWRPGQKPPLVGFDGARVDDFEGVAGDSVEIGKHGALSDTGPGPEAYRAGARTAATNGEPRFSAARPGVWRALESAGILAR